MCRCVRESVCVCALCERERNPVCRYARDCKVTHESEKIYVLVECEGSHYHNNHHHHEDDDRNKKRSCTRVPAQSYMHALEHAHSQTRIKCRKRKRKHRVMNNKNLQQA